MDDMTCPLSHPPIDADAIARFVKIVFGYLDGNAPVRLLAESGTRLQAANVTAVPVADLADHLVGLAPNAARSLRGVYVVPGTVTGTKARAEDIRETGVILVDLDSGDTESIRNHLETHLGLASLVVRSGGITETGQARLHLYWRLTEAAQHPHLQQVAALRAMLADKVHGDPSFASLHQPIRVPGTIHGKNGVQNPTAIIAVTNLEYDLTALAEAIDAMPPLTGVAAKPNGFSATKAATSKITPQNLATRKVRAASQDGITRFTALSKVIGHWIRTARRGDCTLDDAQSAVSDYNAAMIMPPWEEERLRREFEALLAKDVSEKGPISQPSPARTAAAPTTAVPLSEDALAANLVATHGPDWRYVAPWSAWFHWTGTCWERDDVAAIRETARHICRGATGAARSDQEARRIASDKTMNAVQRIAAADPAIALRAQDLDAHPMLLNTPGGIIDLTSGEVRPHNPALHLTQITTASVGSGCPRWIDFLAEITGGDNALQSYLCRLAGYCLTGSTVEQVFAFLHGSGANGKSVFLRTLETVMGTYAATATLDTFMEAQGNRHLTELAGLRAARLVIVSETETGRGWAEARIKAVTGGETIRANFMRQDHFEFTPQFKLLVAGNHRPTLRSAGEAMRRRLHLVPLEVTIPLDKRDPRLAEKLFAERDGILGWMLDGCRAWQRQGLAPPPSVVEAAKDYLASEDLIGQWLAECCLTGPHLTATSATLYGSWRAWAERGGIAPESQKSLGEALRQRGFVSAKVAGQRGWRGLSLAHVTPRASEGAP